MRGKCCAKPGLGPVYSLERCKLGPQRLGVAILTMKDLSQQRHTLREIWRTDPYRILCEIVIQGVL